MLGGYSNIKRNAYNRIVMIEELITKYFSGQCDAKEKLVIINYLREHPEEVENYFSEAEWDSFTDNRDLDNEVSNRMRSNIHKSITPKVVSIKRWIIAAASVLIFITIGIKFLVTNKVSTQPAIQKTASQLISKTNNTDSVMRITLADNSQVKLMPGSKISYYSDYGIIKRDITLTGEAIFHVAKNKTKPFTVYSNELSTTALGTRFKVTAYNTSKSIKVFLYEGKVVIHKLIKLADSYYLLPGDALEYDRKTLIANVILNVRKDNLPKPGYDINIAPSNWYMFNNQNLSQVFEQVEAIYNVEIKYAYRDINNIKFIGKIEKTDSIETILKDIAKINNLKVIKNGRVYTIKKR